MPVDAPVTVGLETVVELKEPLPVHAYDNVAVPVAVALRFNVPVEQIGLLLVTDVIVGAVQVDVGAKAIPLNAVLVAAVTRVENVPVMFALYAALSVMVTIVDPEVA